jgi:hypothetical protein
MDGVLNSHLPVYEDNTKIPPLKAKNKFSAVTLLRINLRSTGSDYPFSILDLQLLITPLVS